MKRRGRARSATAIVGPNAGDLISEAALAIEMGCDAEDIGLTIHPHPTLSETFAHVGGGVCGHADGFVHAEEEVRERTGSRRSLRLQL